MYENIPRCLNLWCHKIRRGLVSLLKKILQLQQAAVERCNNHRFPRASSTLLPIFTLDQLGRVVRTVAMWFNACGCTSWRLLPIHIFNLNRIRSRITGNIHSQRRGNMFSRHTKSSSRPSPLPRNFLNAGYYTNSSLLLLKVVIFTMTLLMSSKNIFLN